jgi:hypothetical protein
LPRSSIVISHHWSPFRPPPAAAAKLEGKNTLARKPTHYLGLFGNSTDSFLIIWE